MSKDSIVLLAFLVYIFIRCVYVEPNSLEITKYQISDKELNGIRIIFLSDFHLKKRDYKTIETVVKLTNRQDPDIVLLGGDYTSSKKRKNMNYDTLAQKLSNINAPKFAVLGETDWDGDGVKLAEALNYAGITVLENASKTVFTRGIYVDIIGVADCKARRPDLNKALNKTYPPRILVTHNPDVFYDIVEDINLVLAGHTHGGQFVLPFTPPLFVPSKYGAKFASGLVSGGKGNANQMIISKGIGESVLPVRLNCKPEIVVVDFIQ